MTERKVDSKLCVDSYFYFGLDMCQDVRNFMGNLVKKIKCTKYSKMVTRCALEFKMRHSYFYE